MTNWTFTGVDEKTDRRWLMAIAQAHPEVEFAVLVGSQTGETPIFPSTKFVEGFRDWAAEVGVRTAIHLCGRFSRTVCHTSPGAVDRLVKFVSGFGRVQVNMSTDDQHFWSKTLCRFAGRVPEMILQHRGDWDTVLAMFANHPRIRFLFDRSGGRGLEAEWPAPPNLQDLPQFVGKPVGYAGGIGPYNTLRARKLAADHPGAVLWFDMERLLRTNGLFDLEKVETVIRQAVRPVYCPACPDSRELVTQPTATINTAKQVCPVCGWNGPEGRL